MHSLIHPKQPPTIKFTHHYRKQAKVSWSLLTNCTLKVIKLP